MGDVEVIVSDSGASDADAAAVDFTEGLLVGAAAAAAADAQETADAAEAEAAVAVAVASDDADRIGRLEALIVALHDEMLANDAMLADNLALLLDAEEATMEEAQEAEIEAATAEAEVTEIVEEHAEEHAEREQSSESAESSPEAPPAENNAGESGQHERAGGGSIRFRRGRRR